MRCKHSNVFSWHLLIGQKFNQEGKALKGKGCKVKEARKAGIEKREKQFNVRFWGHGSKYVVFSFWVSSHVLCYTKSSGLVAQLVRAPPCHGGGRRFESDLGRSTVKTVGCYNGVLAQLGEHLPYKQRVIGSSPIGPRCRCGSIGRAADL